MKFLLDAQLPRRLAFDLIALGHDTSHTLDLPLGNTTPDVDIAGIAASEERFLLTKDRDFVTTYLLKRTPPKLLLLSTGNIINSDLRQLIVENLSTLESAFNQYDFVELSRTSLTIHS